MAADVDADAVAIICLGGVRSPGCVPSSVALLEACMALSWRPLSVADWVGGRGD